MASKRIAPLHPTRRGVLLGTGAIGLGLGGGSGKVLAQQPAPAVVRGQTMTISLWGGPFAKAVREALIPDFEKDHGVRVAIEEGLSADSMAKVQMERERPKRTVIGIDDIFIPMLRNDKLISPVTVSDVPNLADVHREFVVEDNYGIGAAVNYATMYYNTNHVKTPPDSYAAFWNPAYKGRVSLASARSTFGILTMMAATALKTGKPISEAQYDIDLGFQMMKELKPDLYSIVDSSITVAPLLVKGEIWLTFINSRFMTPYALRNGPVARAPVKEGAFMLLNTMALVANSPLQEQGKDFMNRMLSEKVQLAMSTAGYTGPVNRKVVVPAEIQPHVPYGDEAISKLVRIDLQNFTKNWTGWVERWNKEIAS